MVQCWRLLLILMGFAAPSICDAEVMDKEPTLSVLWVVGVFGALSGLLAFKKCWWLLFLSSLLTLLFFISMILEVNSVGVGEEIRSEAGEFYIVSVYLGFLTVLLSHLVGFVIWKRSRK